MICGDYVSRDADDKPCPVPLDVVPLAVFPRTATITIAFVTSLRESAARVGSENVDPIRAIRETSATRSPPSEGDYLNFGM